jgi:hypothetical protein
MTVETEAPRRFTAEQVLAVFEAAGTHAAPMTTKQIGEAVRVANGFPAQRAENGRMHQDVMKTLAELVVAGRLVTSRAKQWRRVSPLSDRAHEHLIAAGNNTERFYATPAQSEAWKARLEAIGDSIVRAGLIADEIGQRWNAPVGLETEYAGEPRIRITLTLDQAARLFGIGVES